MPNARSATLCLPASWNEERWRMPQRFIQRRSGVGGPGRRNRATADCAGKCKRGMMPVREQPAIHAFHFWKAAVARIYYYIYIYICTRVYTYFSTSFFNFFIPLLPSGALYAIEMSNATYPVIASRTNAN